MQSAEIITIGTEILLGEINDTNSLYLSQELAGIGINCFYHTTVGDNPARIIDCLKHAAKRSDLIITTGGLGPTPDDLTIECIAEAFRKDLVRDESTVSALETFYKGRGKLMPKSNLKQADRPEGSTLIFNPVGTAPGIILELSREELDCAGQAGGRGCTIISFPGVPSEMKRMWRQTTLPFLKGKGSAALIVSSDLKFIGIGESKLAEDFQDLLSGVNPTVAPYAGSGECKLRVVAKALSLAEASQLAEPIIEDIIARGAPYHYGRDKETLESVIAGLLVQQDLTISVAESCTGGLVSKRLTNVPGSSRFIKLNFVTYSNEAKISALGVSEDTLEKYGAVSAECAAEMAKGTRSNSHCDIGVSVTGIAGPGGGTVEKPVGLVYLGLNYKDKAIIKELRINPEISRSEIRHRTTNECLNMIRLVLQGVL